MNNNEPIWQKHQFFMTKAIELAEQAYKKDEVPVGAVVVKENKVIGKGYNQIESLGDATAHAEMIALSAAYETNGSKYLHGATLYVSLEPCVMCAGALIWSKIDRLVFGASDSKSGACGSLFNIHNNPLLNHRFEVIQGILEADAENLLKRFFAKKRQKG
ncbi:MAG: tRNA adenosine(34) deaminase TadA [Bacteroidota bacterium]|nr:tRNA adenosine(34) deaminase TadA [Bacteroidota bacterium]